MVRTRPLSLLSGNALKLIAAALMVLDHIGVIFFWDTPGETYLILRRLGRLSMPIFAYFIAEGCRYTRSPLGYLGKLFACLVVCQIGNYVGTGSWDICILGTFFIGAALLFCLQNAKKALFSRDLEKGAAWLVLLLLGIAATYYVNLRVYIDYGFWACLLPVLGGLFFLPENAPAHLKKWDNKGLGLLCFAVCLCLLVLLDDYREMQAFCLLSLPFLGLYSGKRGKGNMKYFFYLFYPIHLALLEGIYQLVKMYA